MIDIDDFEKRALQCQRRFWMTLRADDVLALIAEIRRLRGNGERRKCPCGGKPVVMGPTTKKYWVECEDCQCGTDFRNTPEEAWAAWDGVEG